MYLEYISGLVSAKTKLVMRSGKKSNNEVFENESLKI
jgi:hypothetical protein